ncbi:jg5559 [Pararge aegeria aegeria]|uniref:Jg5559 protein n=1 Tax=Pararge aegeria aegeria TaxID=348720 RepID=A0A8S4RIZ6_9NEOP|nr:jg5559 [Pararge aegeria aegeria]
MRGERRWRLQSACGCGGCRVRGARGRRAAGRHFSVLEEPRYTSVSGGCSLADSVAEVCPAALGPRARAGHVLAANRHSPTAGDDTSLYAYQLH